MDKIDIINETFELDESSYSEEEKVELWAQGKRRENVKACKEEKLIRYYKIAKAKGYNNVCKQIEDVADSKGIILPGRNVSTPEQTSKEEPKEEPKEISSEKSSSPKRSKFDINKFKRKEVADVDDEISDYFKG